MARPVKRIRRRAERFRGYAGRFRGHAERFRAHAGRAFVACLLMLAASLASADVCREIDARWFRQTLVDQHLSRWLSHAATESGLFRAAFDRAWNPAAKQPNDLTAQSRLVYVMVSGYELTGDRRYLEAAVRGADFLLARFSDNLHPGFVRRVDASGAIADSSKHTYGHAFAIFALAHAYRVTRDQRYREAAFRTWYTLDVFLRDPRGGFRPEAPRDFGPTSGLRTQNPVMHLFEAMLALWDATRDPVALRGAQGVGDFVLRHLLEGLPDGGAYIPEWYDGNWTGLAKGKGGTIDLGHQFEWAYLLSAGEKRGLPPLYAKAAERLLDYGLRVGYDPSVGGIFGSAEPDHVVRRSKGWWQQAELLRALMHHASLRGRSDLWPRFRQTLGFVRSEFVDEANGGWYGAPRAECVKSKCGDRQAGVGYHVTAMHREAIDLAADCRKNTVR